MALLILSGTFKRECKFKSRWDQVNAAAVTEILVFVYGRSRISNRGLSAWCSCALLEYIPNSRLVCLKNRLVIFDSKKVLTRIELWIKIHDQDFLIPISVGCKVPSEVNSES